MKVILCPDLTNTMTVCMHAIKYAARVRNWESLYVHYPIKCILRQILLCKILKFDDYINNVMWIYPYCKHDSVILGDESTSKSVY